MTDEQTIEQRLAPSAILSHALEFVETDLDANACNVISSWVARATHEIKEELARLQAIDPETLKGLPAARMKIESGRLWLHVFTQIQEAIARYAPTPRRLTMPSTYPLNPQAGLMNWEKEVPPVFGQVALTATLRSKLRRRTPRAVHARDFKTQPSRDARLH